MKKFALVAIGIIMIGGFSHGLTRPVAGVGPTTICQTSSGTFAGSAVSPIAADEGASVRSAQALAWLKRMMQPIKNAGDGSTISPQAQYDASYRGTVSGSFELIEPREVVSSSPLRVTTPTPLADNYRGVVNGTSRETGARFEVRAYLFTDSEYEQPSVVPAKVSDDGSWSLDLSPVSVNRSGSWRFRLYDTVTTQQVGNSWPRAETYKDIVVQSYSVTDSAYLQHTQAARSDGSWSFASSGNGEKMFRLYDTASGQILAEYFQPPSSGLIRSYEYMPGQDGYGTSRAYNSYMYDQALALLVAVGADDRVMADELLKGFAAVQVPSGPFAGAFPSNADQRNPSLAATDYYTGGNAFVAYSLGKYYQRYGNNNDVKSMLERVLGFLDSQQTTSGLAAGLYRGGGEIESGGEVSHISWYSTEHNTDLWHVYELVGRVLDSEYQQKAENLAAAIVEKFWNHSEQRFNQGFNNTASALDTASWGAIFLAAINENEKAVQSIRAAEAYQVTRGQLLGYTPYLRDSSIPTIWYEGTFGVALAQRIIQDDAVVSAAEILRASNASQSKDGAWQYALDADPDNGRTDAYSVASTAWYLLATDYASVMWTECLAPTKPEVPPELTPLAKPQLPVTSPKIQPESSPTPAVDLKEAAALLKAPIARSAQATTPINAVGVSESTNEEQINTAEKASPKTISLNSQPSYNDENATNSEFTSEPRPSYTPVVAGVGAVGLGLIGLICYVIYRLRHGV